MAAGAYKGLTIRIGADTTRLTSALRGANSVIYKTQSELNKLNRAAKLDSGSSSVAGRQLKATSDQVIGIASKIDTLRSGLAELGSTELQGATGTVADLARETENARLAAEKARQTYVSIGEQLKEIYKPIKESTGINLHESVNNRTFDEDITLLRQVGEITIEEEIHIRELQERWNEARKALDDYADATQLESMKNEIAATEAQLTAMARSYAKLSTKSNLVDTFKDVDDELRLVDAAAESATSRMERLKKAAEMQPGSIALAVDRVKNLDEALENARSRADLLKKKIAEYKASGVEQSAAKIKNVSKAFQDAQERTAKAKKELEDYRTRVDATEDGVKELERALREAEEAGEEVARVQEWQELETQLHEVNAEAERLKDSLSVPSGGFGAAAINAATAIGDVARDMGRQMVDASDAVDQSYRDLRKTFDATETDYQHLYDAAMKYSQSNVTSADTMLEMEAIAAQLGVGLEGGASAIEHFAEVAANLDVATDIDSETIALQMGQITNVMSDLRPDNVERFADALVRLGNTMPTQESNIMQIAQRLSTVGGVAGLTTPQVLGWAAAVASTGQRSEAAATGISNTITAIHSAVARGGDDLTAFAEVAGKSADEFAEMWRSRPSDALELFISKLSEAGDEAIVKLEDLGIEGIRQTQTLLGLAATSEKVAGAIDMANEAFGDEANGIASAGDAAKEAGRKAEGFSGSLAKLNNSTQVLSASFADALVPYLDLAAGAVRTLTGLLDYLGDGFKSAVVGVGGLFTAIAVGYPIVSRLGDSLSKMVVSAKAAGAIKIGRLVRDFGDASIQVKGLGTAFLSLASGGLIAKAAILGVAGVALAAFAIKAYNAWKHAKDLNDALSGMKENTSDLARELTVGTKSVSSVGTTAKQVTANIDDLIDSVKEYNRKNAETRATGVETVSMLQKYKDIVHECAGAEEVSADKKALLEWALKGIKEATGEAFMAEQVLTGEYQNQDGEIENTIEAIDRLIDAKKREARVNAASEMYTEAVKERMKAEEELKKAEEAANKRQQDYIDANLGKKDLLTGEVYTRERLIEKMKAEDGEYIELNKRRLEAKRILEGLTDDEEAYLKLLTDYQRGSMEGWGDREAIMRTNDAMREALTTVTKLDNEGIRKLAESIEDAGVSVDDFGKITQDQFVAMVNAAGNDVDSLVDRIAAFNALPIDDKDTKVTVDDDELVYANGERIVWNGSEYVWKSTGVAVDASSIEAADQELAGLSDDADAVGSKKVEAVVTVDTSSGVKNVQTLNKTIDKVPKNPKSTFSISVIGQAALNAISSTLSWLNGRQYSSTYTVVKKEHNLTANASGGHVPYGRIPRHADGIFTRPTLTNIGWVGEDGAELYSGNSLIPLTNRKYSMPYINDISDAVARKLGGGGVTYNLYIDDARINDDPAIQAAMLDLFATLQRRGAMNVG